jgi:ligand-binding SRPBCC domain-containing protein
MSRIHTIRSVQRIPAELEDTWRFFSDPNNLLNITPPFLNLKVLGEIHGTETYPGQIITYKVRPLFGIPVFWMTEITHMERMKLFVDEQRKGPYSLWHHQHHFKSIEGGTEMTDLVHYRVPLGFIGNLAHSLMVKGQLQKVFNYRYQKITELFGPWPGGDMQMVID